jgi:transcriptional regulator with XRE-family HTH domain
MNSFADFFNESESDYRYLAQKLAVDFLADVNREIKAQQLSNSDLAAKMSVSPAYITKLFRGTCANPSLETLTKLALALDRCVQIRLAPRSEIKNVWWARDTEQVKAAEPRPAAQFLQYGWINQTALAPNEFAKSESSNSDFYNAALTA